MSFSAPSPPDPVATANAQQALNENTAKYQAETNNVNQTNPYGSLTYSQTGTNPDGSPIFAANTTLNAPEQKLFDTGVATQTTMADDANALAHNLGSSLTTAPNLNNSALVNQMQGWGTQVLQPQLNQEQSQLNSTLANQGIPQGSAAWENAQRSFSQDENMAYANLFANEEPTAYNQALQSYEAPIQTLGTLLGESQPGSVNSALTQTPQETIQPANEESLVQQDYQSQLQNYQNTMSGLFSIPSALLGGWARTGFATSDRRAKGDVVQVGELFDGTPVYRFRYRSGGPMQIGLMAQDIADRLPDAVCEGADGFLMVDYKAATDRSAWMTSRGA